MVWLREALRILREEKPGIQITLSSGSSPELAGALMRGKVDLAFLRREAQASGLAFKFLIQEPLVAVLPSGIPSRPARPFGRRISPTRPTSRRPAPRPP